MFNCGVSGASYINIELTEEGIKPEVAIQELLVYEWVDIAPRLTLVLPGSAYFDSGELQSFRGSMPMAQNREYSKLNLDGESNIDFEGTVSYTQAAFVFIGP